MRDHESTHNSPISTSDSQQSLFSSEGVSTKPAPEKDDTFNYQCALLEYGMVILHFLTLSEKAKENAFSDAGNFNYLISEMMQGVPDML